MSEVRNVIDFLEAGMRAEGIRQKAIANNIANVETPGYRRYDVEFRDMLAKAMEDGSDIDPDEIDMELYQPMETMVKSNGNDVGLEYEIGEMVKNTLRHKAYVRLMNKKYAQMDLAMSVR